ncbi:MAG: DUF2490 domain-containing protein [Panacibacter sp.]
MKIIIKIFSVFIFLTAASHVGYSQDLNFPGIAPALSLSDVLNKKLDINLLAVSKIRVGQHIVKDIKYDPQVSEIYTQVLLSYKIDQHWQIGGGYGFQRNNPFQDNWRNEHRLVQQASFNNHGIKLQFYNRFRFEERWFSYPTAPNQSGTRARYKAGLIKKLKGDNVYWQINDEVYAITSGPKNAFISENWIYTGFGFPVKPLGRFETGIGYNTVVRNSNKDLLNLLLLQVSWSFIFPSAKMKTMNPVMHSRHF